jgi:phenylpyruvate tautomerase PptA (4-oxalocrotonate tautomerase family)
MSLYIEDIECEWDVVSSAVSDCIKRVLRAVAPEQIAVVINNAGESSWDLSEELQATYHALL